MALFDLLGRHWTMGIIWNLEQGPATFRELQARCENVSPTVLNRRLAELRGAGIVEHSEQGYRLTRPGTALYGLLVPLGTWSKNWARRLERE
ncbi:winged helix-turn-helix transcriptional regulator [Tahibacter amnicola]|uniref:Helix-turn-helix transcriptional regulator n=1 Tax=Tahibacter amnicola TaxID=2976241 RepID=A0ABY6BGT4_9GAMM|nr:helix-turn-helix domain-containing protein [Tahibacter amnicola]UXI67077.1 helix-turn-helix transcriptional regulator [Tahibacter amnicola]